MDFSNHQHQNHYHTTRFIILFISGMFLIPLLIAFIIQFIETKDIKETLKDFPIEIAEVLFAGLCIVVIPIALFKFSQIKTGGHIIAEELGGRPIDPRNTNNFQESQLVNVVDELSIIVNIPRPLVYILDHQEGINAFTAGYHLNNVVIGVTKGALNLLTREELMVLVGHEISHILNKDMRMNTKFSAIIFGLYSLLMMGLSLIMNCGKKTKKRFLNEKRRGRASIAMALFFAFSVIGSVLYIWGNIIQTSISRKREYLADTFAIQITHMPYAMVSLLQKIGGHLQGSKITGFHNRTYEHIFFSSSARMIFPTHPSLQERILRIDPTWNGQYIIPQPLYNNYTIEEDSFWHIEQQMHDIHQEMDEMFQNLMDSLKETKDPFE